MVKTWLFYVYEAYVVRFVYYTEGGFQSFSFNAIRK